MSLQRQVLAKVTEVKMADLSSRFVTNRNFDWMQIASKRDPEREREAQLWVEEIVGQKFTVPFEDALRDGQVLCHLINKLAPGSITKINTAGAQFKMMENIQK